MDKPCYLPRSDSMPRESTEKMQLDLAISRGHTLVARECLRYFPRESIRMWCGKAEICWVYRKDSRYLCTLKLRMLQLRHISRNSRPDQKVFMMS